MYRFRSKINKATLESRYKAIYVHAGLQRKWNREIAGCPELVMTLPAGKLPEDLLTMKYEDLVDVYTVLKQDLENLQVIEKIL